MSGPLRPDEGEALADWATRVRANRDQVDRVREVADGADFYAPVSARFRADPARRDEPALDLLLEIARPGTTWLDIGSGAGRYALPLALHGVHVVAIDPSQSMLAGLREGMAEHGIEAGERGIEIVEGRWPITGLAGDVSLIANVGYDIESIGPFMDAMETASSDSCVAIMANQAPSSASDPFWPEVHGEERRALPALPEFLALLLARGSRFEVRLAVRPGPRFASLDEALTFARRQLWVEPGGAKDRRLQALVADRLRPRGDSYDYGTGPSWQGVVRWWPNEGRR